MIAALNTCFFIIDCFCAVGAVFATDAAFSQSCREMRQKLLAVAAGMLGMLVVLTLLMERVR